MYEDGKKSVGWVKPNKKLSNLLFFLLKPSVKMQLYKTKAPILRGFCLLSI